MSPNVAYPGPVGTHTSAAAATLFPTDTLVPLVGFRAVADAVVSHEATFGVLPIESSLVGAVAETHDLLYERALSIVGETILPIRHCLAASASIPLDEIRTVRSHPTALDQCRSLLERMPKASVIASSTTAEAGRQAAEDGDPTVAVIVGEEAVDLYGLTGLDLVRLVSRPLPATPWKYRFDAVVAGHPLDPAVRVALRELEAVTRTLRVVGVYEGHTEEGA